MKRFIMTFSLGLVVGTGPALTAEPVPSKVDFSAFVQMAEEVREFRQDRLVGLDRFLELARQPGTVILDTRPESTYRMRHLKGAIHLNFSAFTAEKLAELIPDRTTTVLIYCNNNFKDDPMLFALKSPPLALNIPTFINLHGYGYRNIYELSELLSIKDPRLEFEGRLPGPTDPGPTVESR